MRRRAPSNPRAPSARVPTDFVILADCSGSMGGDRMESLKEALRILVGGGKDCESSAQLFGPRDRVALVRFTHEVEQATRLAPLADADGVHRKAYLEAVKGCAATGGTDILKALIGAKAVLDCREEKNPGAHVLLLSDGQDKLSDEMGRMVASDPGVTWSTFGFGCVLPCDPGPGMRLRGGRHRCWFRTESSFLHAFPFFNCEFPCSARRDDHEPVLLSFIARHGRGTFSYVENPEVLSAYMTSFVSDATRVVALDTRVRILPAKGVTIEVPLVREPGAFTCTSAAPRRELSLIVTL